MNKEQYHDKAWDLLDEKGLSRGEKMMVRSHFVEWSGYKEEYPFIVSKKSKGRTLYKSEIEQIKMLSFKSEHHVILANAIYENTKEDFNINEFLYQFKYVVKLIK